MFIGVGSWTGLDTSAYALGPLQMPALARPTLAEVAWTVALGLAAAVFVFVVVGVSGYVAKDLVDAGDRISSCRPPASSSPSSPSPSPSSPTTASTRSCSSGQDALPGLVGNAAAWSSGALALLLLAKGLAWGDLAGQLPGRPDVSGAVPRRGGGPARLACPASGSAPPWPSAWAPWWPPCSSCRCPPSSWPRCSRHPPALGLQPLVIIGVVVAYVATVRLERLLVAPRATLRRAGPRR